MLRNKDVRAKCAPADNVVLVMREIVGILAVHTGADAPSESEGVNGGIGLCSVSIPLHEAIWVEFHRVGVDGFIVHEGPVESR